MNNNTLQDTVGNQMLTEEFELFFQVSVFYCNKIWNFFSLVLLELEAGSVGLALSYSVTLMGMFQWGVRQSAEVENMVRCSFCLDCIYNLYLAEIWRIYVTFIITFNAFDLL